VGSLTILRARVVVVHRRLQRLTLELAGERDDRGRTAARRGQGAGVEVVRHLRAVGHRLVEVAMAVDATGQDPAARGVDLPRCPRQPARERGDRAVLHADVRVEDVGGSGDPGVADHQVELTHGRVSSSVSNSAQPEL
jgi:hypothetical protein